MKTLCISKALTVLLIVVWGSPGMANAQLAYNDSAVRAGSRAPQVSLQSILLELQEEHQVSISFKDSNVDGIEVTGNFRHYATVEDALANLLTRYDLKYEKIEDKVFVVFREEKPSVLHRESEPPVGGPTVMPVEDIIPLTKDKDVVAQGTLVSGVVTSADGSGPMAGVNILLKGTTSGTSTDANGNYSIEVPGQDAVLVFSFIGYASQEVIVGARTAIDVTLTSDQRYLDEVVVVAYGTVRKGANTASTVQVNFEDFQSRPLTNIVTALDGAAPGIQMLAASGQPGSAPAVRIRGFGSINASSNPLYVVDGVVYDGGLSNFNMEDIESISVMKDAASTALYGSRGANGVIIITTKKGNRNHNGFSFKASHGFVSRAIPEYEKADAFGYYPLMWQAQRNSLVASGQDLATASQNATNGIFTSLGYNPFNVPDDQIVSTDGTLNPAAQLLWQGDLDWQKYVERQGSRQEYSISYNGGNDKSTYYGSIGYLKEEGFIIKSHQQRFMGRLNLTTQPQKWIRTGINLAGTFANSNNARVASSTRLDNPFYVLKNMGPIYPVHEHDLFTGEYLLDGEGNRIHDYGAARPGLAFGGKHIVAETQLSNDTYDRNFFSGRTFIDLNFTEHLTFTTNLSADYTDSYTSVYGNNIIGNDAPGGSSLKQTDRARSVTFNQLLNYNRSFGSHTFGVLVGHESYDLYLSGVSAERRGQVVADNYELTNFATITGAGSSVDMHRLESFLSRVNYDYNERFFVSGSYRRDGNSRFKREYRWDDFYSLGVAWRLDRETFLRPIGWIDALKLRSSYGRVGNDAGVGYYPYQALYALGFNNANEPGIRQSSLPNDDITWEGQKTMDVGIDFGLFNSRVTGTVEYYHRNSDDLIFAVQLPLSLGGYFVQRNIGSMVNRGLEVQLNGEVVRTAGFSWNLGLNVSTLTNEITRMPPGQPEIISGSKKLMVGHSIFDYWMLDGQGVDPATGDELWRADVYDEDDSFVRAPGDTVTNNSNNARYAYSGSAIPDVFGSITNRFRFRGFELSVLLTYQLGGKIYDASYAGIMHRGTYGVALHEDALRAWKNPGDITDVPRMQDGAPNIVSNRWLVDASFLNLRNVTLSYQVPEALLSRFNATGARVFVSGENLHWFSARKGMNVQQTFTGVTSNAYMPARTISVGLNLNF